MANSHMPLVKTSRRKKDDPRPTIEDVARLAGVSTATVSRVVNREARVSPETQAAVQTAIANLKYRPNEHATRLGRANAGIPRKSNTVIRLSLQRKNSA